MMPFFAAVLPIIILFCGLTIDVGMLQLKRIQMQSAADAAALGGQLEFERGTGNYATMAQQDAGVNGFTNGVNATTVAVQVQASSGAYSNNWDTLQVTITQQVTTIFMGALNGGIASVSAQGVALLTPCTYFTNAANLSGGSPLKLATGTLNSQCPNYVAGGAQIDASSSVSANGNNLTGGAGSVTGGGSMTTAPRYSAVAMADPLAGIAMPTPGGCVTNGANISNYNGGAGPGTYCNGSTIQNSNMTFAPGLYIFTGGLTIANSTFSGSGVTFYFTKGSGGFGQLKMTNSAFLLSAPTSNASGGVPGVLVFNDRTWIKTSNQDFQCSSSSITGDGIWYTTGTGVSFSQCGTVTGNNYFGIVADNLYLFQTTIKARENFSTVASGSPLRPRGGIVQ